MLTFEQEVDKIEALLSVRDQIAKITLHGQTENTRIFSEICTVRLSLLLSLRDRVISKKCKYKSKEYTIIALQTNLTVLITNNIYGSTLDDLFVDCTQIEIEDFI